MHICGTRTLIMLAIVTALARATRASGPAAATRAKQPRATRSFMQKNEMLTARGFGKRSQMQTSTQQQSFDREDFNSADDFWNLLESSQESNIPIDQVEENNIEEAESLPLEWFAEELMQNGDLARGVVRKFIDLNQDGILSSDELLTNIY